MKLFARKGKTTVGLDIGSSLVKMVEVDHSGPEPLLTRYAVVKLPPEAIVEGEIMDRTLVVEGIEECAAKAGIEKKEIVTAVSGRAVIVKKVVMDKMNPDDAKEAIFWEAEQHLPFDIDDVCLDFQILRDDVGADQMEILLVAAKKEMVTTHAELIREAGLEPVIVDVDSFAVQNAYEATHPNGDGKVVALVNIGSDVTNINIIQNHIPHFTRDLSVGGTVFLEALQRELGLSFEEAEALLAGEREMEDEDRVRRVLAEASAELSSGLDRCISFLKTSGEAEHIDEVVLSGGGARVPFLVDILKERNDELEFKINDSLQLVAKAETLEMDGEEELEKLSPILTVSLGLAMRREGE
jgi:type IV pilus assembly protein PilM